MRCKLMSMGLNWPERKTPTMREPAGHEKSNGGKLEDDAHRARNRDKKQKRRPGRRMRDQEIIEGKTGASDGVNFSEVGFLSVVQRSGRVAPAANSGIHSLEALRRRR